MLDGENNYLKVLVVSMTQYFRKCWSVFFFNNISRTFKCLKLGLITMADTYILWLACIYYGVFYLLLLFNALLIFLF